MNFIKAIQHATIGYGIRRKAWSSPDDNILMLNENGELCWKRTEILCQLLGHGRVTVLNAEDIKATDWEAV